MWLHCFVGHHLSSIEASLREATQNQNICATVMPDPRQFTETKWTPGIHVNIERKEFGFLLRCGDDTSVE
jgi:hypothetical protein